MLRKAQEGTGMKLAREFYVYQLIDPRDNSPFYIGKGSGNRIDSHEKAAARGERSRKCDRIRAIKADGLCVRKVKVALYCDEQEAYDHETRLIDSIGLENLTNVMRGGQTAWLDRAAILKKKEQDEPERRKQPDTSYLRKWLAMAEKWPHGGTVPGVRNGDKLAFDFMCMVRQLLTETPMGATC